MFYSYAMGIDESVTKLVSQGFTIKRDGENYTVSFPKENAPIWEAFMLDKLKIGYWNEYLADDTVVFLFRLPEGTKRYEVREYCDDNVLALCESLCRRKFDSIKSMLIENSFYREIIND